MGWFGIEPDEPEPGGISAAEFTSRVIEKALRPRDKDGRFRNVAIPQFRVSNEPKIYDDDGVRVGTRCTCEYIRASGKLIRSRPNASCPRHKGR